MCRFGLFGIRFFTLLWFSFVRFCPIGAVPALIPTSFLLVLDLFLLPFSHLLPCPFTLWKLLWEFTNCNNHAGWKPGIPMAGTDGGRRWSGGSRALWSSGVCCWRRERRGCGYGGPFQGMVRPRWRPGCRRYKGIQLEFVRRMLADSQRLGERIAGQ